MKIKQLLNKKDIIFILTIFGCYFLLRLTNLTKLPIFTDEAIYMRWAQIALHDSSWRFISLTDGKQPLLIWLAMVFMKYLKDPLLSGRLVSAISGFVSVVGIFFLSWELFKKKSIGYFSAVLYLLSPFFLWYDRLALMDSLVTSFFIWSIYLEVLLVKFMRLDIALILGMVIGGGILTKSSAFFAIYLLPIFLLLFEKKKGYKGLLKFTALSLISIIIAFALYSVLRLSPWFHMISEKDHTFIYSISEILNSPFKYFFGNLRGLSNWWVTYFTLPFIILLFIGEKDFRKSLNQRLLLLGLSILPFLALCAFGKVLYPRFILFMSAPLLVIAAYGLDTFLTLFKNLWVKLFIVFIVFVYPLYFDSKIVLDTINAPLPSSDRKQFLDDWPSGWGLPEVIQILKTEKEKQPIFVATEGTFGLFPYALELEFFSDPSIKINGYWPLPKWEVAVLDSDNRPAYLLLKESQKPPVDWKVKLVEEYRRGKGDTFLKFYKLESK